MVTQFDTIPNQSIMNDDPALIMVSQDERIINNMDIDPCDDDDDNVVMINERVKDNFLEAIENYKHKVIQMYDADPLEPGTIKAMKAMTKTMKRSLTCNPHTIQNQMHNFGKGGGRCKKNKKRKCYISKSSSYLSQTCTREGTSSPGPETEG